MYVSKTCLHRTSAFVATIDYCRFGVIENVTRITLRISFLPFANRREVAPDKQRKTLSMSK